MSFGQWLRWRDYYAAEPWGPERDDLRAEVGRLRDAAMRLPQEIEVPHWEHPYAIDGQSDIDAAAEAIEIAERRRRELEANG